MFSLVVWGISHPRFRTKTY